MSKSCKKCGDVFTPKKGLLNFCSLSCRNSRVFSVKSRIKKSIKTKRARLRGVYDHLNMSSINNDKDKINNLESLLRIVLKPLNQFKRKKFRDRNWLY